MSATKHSVSINPDSLKKVTVFQDRAEVKRCFTFILGSGLNEVLIEGVTNLANDDSVRVCGRGNAVIEEVQVAQRRATEGKADSARAALIREEKEKLENEKTTLDDERLSILKRIEALDIMIGQLGTGIAAPKNSKFTANQETLEDVLTFFDFYNTQVLELRKSLAENARRSKKTLEELNVKKSELDNLEHGDFIKVISILIDSSEGGSVELELLYQVWGAGWRPVYDIRVDTKDGKSQMQLYYYGTVSQTSGEDWNEAQLTLSTARPSLGGNVPELGTLDVSFQQPPPPPLQTRTHDIRLRMKTLSANRVEAFAMPQMAGAAYDSPMEHRAVQVSSQLLSTEFSIVRAYSIPSDGADHKVTIGILSFDAELVHESVPSKTASAFLTAAVLNSSSLPLLPGQASIYLDGAFVAKSNIKAVSPGEQFTASLGVDPAVRIEYKPAHKFHEKVQLLLNQKSVTVTEQKIIVKNTRREDVLLIIRESIPRSTDDTIKVKIISPEAVVKVSEENVGEYHSPTAGVRLLPSNNLEWTVSVKQGESQTVLVKYAVEHPLAKEVVYEEKFGN